MAFVWEEIFLDNLMQQKEGELVLGMRVGGEGEGGGERVLVRSDCSGETRVVRFLEEGREGREKEEKEVMTGGEVFFPFF